MKKTITTKASGILSALVLSSTGAATTAVDLKSAGNFSVLAGSEITDTGSASLVFGHVGLSPASGSFIGLATSQVHDGTIFSVDAAGPVGSSSDPSLLTTAQNDLTAAYVDAAGRPVNMALGVVDNQLGGRSLLPGVYSFGGAATANLIGNLTLDGNGEDTPVWIFQASSTLITAANSSVTLINGADPSNVFWQVGSSATIGTNTDFVGNIMADQSITMQTNATLDGRALARIAAVTLDHNTIASIPEASTSLLLTSALAMMIGFRRRPSTSRSNHSSI